MVYDKDTLPVDDFTGEGVVDVDKSAEVKPEDIGALSLRYVDGQPQLVVSGGTMIPAGLTVVDASGNAVATYAAGPASAANSEGAIKLIVAKGLTDAVDK
ncbi:hypothetical protein [Streptomyces sp. NPDC001205]